MVSASSTMIGLTEEGYTTTFRVCAKDDAQAVLMATYFRGYLGMDAVALVEWEGLEPATDAFSDTFAGLGGTITARYTLTSTDDYTATLTAIEPDDPDAVFYADYETSRAGFLSSVADPLGLSVVGWNSGGDEFALDGYADAAGPAAAGDYAGLNLRRLADMPGYDALDAAYQAAGFPNYGDEPQVWGALAYDAVQIILDATVRADSVDPAAIRDAIAATAGYHGVVGTYEGFDAQGDVIPQWSWLAHYWNGEWRALPPYRIVLPVVLND
jgi:branched-chain amino acid transport system substrate-binding protein